MTISVTDVGSATGNYTGAGFSVTVGAAGVPANSLIIAITSSTQGSWTGIFIQTMSDSKSNTYNLVGHATQPGGTNSTIAMFYVFNSIALVNGDTITVKNGNSSVNGVMTICYATGIATASDPLQSACTATKIADTASGFDGGVTLAAAPSAGSLAIGGVSLAPNTGSYTITNPAGWTTPPNSANNGTTLLVGGGNKVTGSADNWTPTTNAADGKHYSMIIAAFSPPATVAPSIPVIGPHVMPGAGLIIPAGGSLLLEALRRNPRLTRREWLKMGLGG